MWSLLGSSASHCADISSVLRGHLMNYWESLMLSVEFPSDLTSRQRAALVACNLMAGEALTSRDIAELTGLGRFGVWRLINDLCGVLPLYRDGLGAWVWCARVD